MFKFEIMKMYTVKTGVHVAAIMVFAVLVD